jgi:hypothetical protein
MATLEPMGSALGEIFGGFMPNPSTTNINNPKKSIRYHSSVTISKTAQSYWAIASNDSFVDL